MNIHLRTLTILALGFLLCCGCSSTQKHTAKSDQSRLQGTWVGQALGEPTAEAKMTITGEALQFRAAAGEEWYDGRLTLDPSTTPKQATFLIEKCSAPKYNGLTSKAIYKVEGDTLTIAATEPGAGTLPSSFEPGNQARVIVFHRQ